MSFVVSVFGIAVGRDSFGAKRIEHLATYRTGDRNHRAVVHVDTRGVAICLERDNPRSAKSSVRHDLQTEDHFLQTLKLGMLQISL